ncbi:hypothetical protein QVD17_00026 [Tagetes erecta]|uniref:Uncharacterized protein n=1 Tax=Tagetes erecta TaxID=13708 RepID=A0AAD8LAU3_TARER|nr:hypothetical protein QVD17_00026 [Tagetes erecta]
MYHLMVLCITCNDSLTITQFKKDMYFFIVQHPVDMSRLLDYNHMKMEVKPLGMSFVPGRSEFGSGWSLTHEHPWATHCHV